MQYRVTRILISNGSKKKVNQEVWTQDLEAYRKEVKAKYHADQVFLTYEEREK